MIRMRDHKGVNSSKKSSYNLCRMREMSSAVKIGNERGILEYDLVSTSLKTEQYTHEVIILHICRVKSGPGPASTAVL